MAINERPASFVHDMPDMFQAWGFCTVDSRAGSGFHCQRPLSAYTQSLSPSLHMDLT